MTPAAEWKVWPTTRPTLVELDPDATSPETAVAAACAWNIGADGGWWFEGGVATLGVESPTGERWTCAAWARPGAAFDSTTLEFSPMVPYVPAAPTERDPRYDPRPGDTYTAPPGAGGLTFRVLAVCERGVTVTAPNRHDGIALWPLDFWISSHGYGTWARGPDAPG